MKVLVKVYCEKDHGIILFENKKDANLFISDCYKKYAGTCLRLADEVIVKKNGDIFYKALKNICLGNVYKSKDLRKMNRILP